jgi:ribonuclease HI
MIIHIDGAARGNPGPAGYGIAVFTENGEMLEEAYGYLGEQTNNVAEYCAMIAALELAKFKKWARIRLKSDSQLMVKQLNGEYKVKNETLKKLFQQAKKLAGSFKEFTVEHVRRKDNKDADRLANKAVDEGDSLPHFINPMVEKPVDSGDNYRLNF